MSASSVPISVAAASSVAAAALAFAVGGIDVARMPQASSGGDVLSVAFGGAKDTISAAMLHKADSYFHGGVDMDCTIDRDHDCDENCGHDHHHHHHHADGEDHGHDGDHDEDHGEDHGHDGDHDGEAVAERGAGGDPWRWINVRVRAPEIEKHLEGDKAVETMPWFWASVKANPHNIDAWTTAWFIARSAMHDRALAWRVIEEAKAKNPDSLEIALTEARHVYDSGRGDSAAARRMFESVAAAALDRCGGDESKLSEGDRWSLKFARTYISDIEKKHSR